MLRLAANRRPRGAGVMPRLFTGLEIPPQVAQSLAMMRGGLPGARWIDPENYHLTLRFIGDIDDALAGEIAGMVGRVRRGPRTPPVAWRGAATTGRRCWRCRATCSDPGAPRPAAVPTSAMKTIRSR